MAACLQPVPPERPVSGPLTLCRAAHEQLGSLLLPENAQARYERCAARCASASARAKEERKEVARRTHLRLLCIAERRRAATARREAVRSEIDAERLQQELRMGRVAWAEDVRAARVRAEAAVPVAAQRALARMRAKADAADAALVAREREESRHWLAKTRAEEKVELERQEAAAALQRAREADHMAVRKAMTHAIVQDRGGITGEERTERDLLGVRMQVSFDKTLAIEARRRAVEEEASRTELLRQEQLQQQLREEQQRLERRHQREQNRIARRCTHGGRGGSALSAPGGARKGCRTCGIKLNPATGNLEPFDFNANRFGKPKQNARGR
eukprot:TRINITY_DN29786_c0_g1_i1.p1 TRINITY_DN29786_c0_g1~~TRINITY_DN29786_c0_g1_i1.p1  ORF type:complete len:344 (+),score=102.25 TRINITY_DN29786_c0_g1_i1:45-1034(+)